MVNNEMIKTKFKRYDLLERIAFGLIDGIICIKGLAIGITKSTRDPMLMVIAGLIGGIADSFGNSIGFYISQATERSVQIFTAKKGNEKVHSSL